MFFCGFDGDLITRVGVSDHAHAGIRCQDSFQSDCGFRRSIRNDDLSRVLTITDAHSAAVMK